MNFIELNDIKNMIINVSEIHYVFKEEESIHININKGTIIARYDDAKIKDKDYKLLKKALIKNSQKQSTNWILNTIANQKDKLKNKVVSEPVGYLFNQNFSNMRITICKGSVASVQYKYGDYYVVDDDGMPLFKVDSLESKKYGQLVY